MLDSIFNQFLFFTAAAILFATLTAVMRSTITPVFLFNGYVQSATNAIPITSMNQQKRLRDLNGHLD